MGVVEDVFLRISDVGLNPKSYGCEAGLLNRCARACVCVCVSECACVYKEKKGEELYDKLQKITHTRVYYKLTCFSKLIINLCPEEIHDNEVNFCYCFWCGL